MCFSGNCAPVPSKCSPKNETCSQRYHRSRQTWINGSNGWERSNDLWSNIRRADIGQPLNRNDVTDLICEILRTLSTACGVHFPLKCDIPRKDCIHYFITDLIIAWELGARLNKPMNDDVRETRKPWLTTSRHLYSTIWTLSLMLQVQYF